MTIQMALSRPSNDLILKAGGGIERVDEGRYVVQNVRSRLRTKLGEWLLDSTIGWINEEDLSHQYSVFDIEVRARQIIQSTAGVLTVLSISSSFEDRILSISFTAETIYGFIDLEVPWTGG